MMEKNLYSKIFQIEQTHWWYVARRDIIFDWVFRILGQQTQAKVLDVGCGTGYNIEFIKDKGYQDVLGLDISPEALGFCQLRELTGIVCGDAISIPFADQSFDMVMALDIVEHLDEDQQGLDELSRLLKQGGTLVIFVPAFQFLWSLQDEVSHHCRRYTSVELRQKTLQAGLEIVKLSYANSLLFPLVWIGRMVLRMVRSRMNLISEADLSPVWSNVILEKIFSAERTLLRWINFPAGVSILCICRKPVND